MSPSELGAAFHAIDRDGDGVLTWYELECAGRAYRARNANSMMRPAGYPHFPRALEEKARRANSCARPQLAPNPTPPHPPTHPPHPLSIGFSAAHTGSISQ